MDNTIALSVGLDGLGSFLTVLVHALFLSAQPALDLMVPVALAYLFHRYIRNQTAANALSDLAGTAYLHLGSQYAATGAITFGAAKRIAIEAAVAGMDSASKAAVAHLTRPEIASSVAGRLGSLLAKDTTFDVTDPQGRVAAQNAMALAAATTPAPAIAVAVGEPAKPETPAVAVTAPPSFDVEAFQDAVRDAIRRGIDAAATRG